MKKLRFLLIPKSNNFRDIINIKDISYELKKKGYECICLTSQISDGNLEYILEEESFNYVLRVNKGKPEKINKNIRFISWLKDISDSNDLLNFNENDLIYTLKRCSSLNKKLKITQMMPAANSFKKINTLSDYELIDNKTDSFQNIDMSIVSNYTRAELFNGNKEVIYKKNKKNSDKYNNLQELIHNLDKKYITEVYGLIDYSKINKNKNIVFNGEINNFNYFFEVFRKSKFNILFEDEYIDFNTNFFNILMVQGTLIFDKKLLTQIQDYLRIEKDYSNYFLNYDNSQEFNFNISSYYDNYKKRIEIGRNAAGLIKKKHLYKNRVDQLMNDLK